MDSFDHTHSSFYGIQRRAECELMTRRYRAFGAIARHQHYGPYAAIVLSGSYVEAGDMGRYRVAAGDVIIHRAFEAHSDAFDRSGAEILDLPLHGWRGDVRHLIQGRVPDVDKIVLQAEKNLRDGITLMFASAVPVRGRSEDWPDMLAQDLLDDPDLSISNWARERKMHPGSVARGFRLQFGISAAEFRARARVHKALRHLPGNRPLAQVALDAGFADQAHMSRAIRQMAGLSPKKLRAVAGSWSIPNMRWRIGPCEETASVGDP